MKIAKTLELKVSHSTFSIIFPTLLYIIFNAINFDKIYKWFYLGDQIDYFSLIAYLIFGLSVFITIFLFFSHKWTIKIVSIAIVILSTAAAYFIAKYNVAIDGSMILNTVYTDPTEVKALLSIHMIPYVVFLMIPPIIAIFFIEITFHQPIRHLLTSLSIATVSLIIGLSLVYMNFTGIHRAGNTSNKYIQHSLVPVNFLISGLSEINNALGLTTSKGDEDVEITGHITSQDDLLVVLAVGETARQKSLSLYGYDGNETTPVLDKVENLYHLNGIARIGTTLYALPEILESSDIKLPTITSKLGIDTSCYVNFTLYDNCSTVGEIEVGEMVDKDGQKIKCNHKGKCYDEDVIPMLDKNLESYKSGYRFVVLHLGGGSHGPKYSDRYPPEFQKFKPMCHDADVVNNCTPEQLYNSFDNTILYTDHVLGKIIQNLDDSGAPYVFIYVSDHGESLLEEGRIFHGMPPGISLPPEQAQVPLIVKSSLPIEIIKRDEYMQPDIYHTVLDLFSIDTDILEKDKVFIKKIEGEDKQPLTQKLNSEPPPG